MSVTEDLPDMDGVDLLGILCQYGETGANDPFFTDGNGLENWLAEQDLQGIAIGLYYVSHQLLCQKQLEALCL